MAAVAPAVQARHKTASTRRFDAAVPRKLMATKVCKEGAVQPCAAAEAGQPDASPEAKAARVRA